MPRPLSPGDRFPDFVLPLNGGSPTHFCAKYGGCPIIIILCPDATDTAIDRVTQLGALCPAVAVASRPTDRISDVFVDADHVFLKDYVSDEACVCVLDANLRVVWAGPTESLDQIRSAVRELSGSGEPRTIERQAPVLLVDRVLEADRCGFLMHLWESEGAVETGVEVSTGHGRDEVIAKGNKSRRDLTIQDDKLTQLLTQSIGRRLLSEIERAFVYRPTRFEGFKVACYDAASSGFFSAHRDNLSPSTAHRRLVVSLNLNDAYEGGQLRFPEFGQDLYRPPAGGALVFSSSLLHEVLPVTSGKRFTLLTFLYDERVQRETQIDPFAV